MGKRKTAMEKRMEEVKRYEIAILEEVVAAYDRQPQFGMASIITAWKYKVGKLKSQSSRKGLVSLASLNIARKLQTSLERMR